MPEPTFGLQSEQIHFVQNECDAGADIWSQLALKPPQAERTKEKDTEERQGSILTDLTGSFDSAAFSDRCCRNAKKNKERLMMGQISRPTEKQMKGNKAKHFACVKSKELVGLREGGGWEG